MKWMKNSSKVLECVQEADRAKNVKNVDLTAVERPIERIVFWVVERIQFGYNISLKEKPLTRSGILSAVGSSYDPLGFAALYTLTAKKVMQDIARLRTSWDEEIPENLRQRWLHWCMELQRLADLRVMVPLVTFAPLTLKEECHVPCLWQSRDWPPSEQ